MNGTTQNGHADIAADIIIVGGGFGGCIALYELRRQGYSVKLLEAGTDFGGVWHWNRYPGARVDTETPLYQLDQPRVWDTFNFTERFPGGEEIRQYFAHVADVLDLRKDAIFSTKVSKAQYHKIANKWVFSTESGLTVTSQYAVFAAGSTNKAYIPDFPNLSKFRGKLIHPSAWPNDLDTTGKNIGIVGQGASGVQIVQELAPQDCNLTVFIRNPIIGIPMGQRTIPEVESETLKNNYNAWFHTAKYIDEAGNAYNKCDVPFHDETKEQRLERQEILWARGSYAWLACNHANFMVDKEINAEVYQFWSKKVRERITDKAKADIVAPLKQFQWIGTKRPSLEMNYYEMIDRPNVSLVDLKVTPIKEFTETGIVAGEKVHDLDIVIFATGYDSVTGSLYDMNIHDKDGILLQEKWKEGIRTHVGMMVPGLPNAFFLYGPQAPTSHTNGPPFLELQVEWIAKILQKIKDEDVKSIEPTEKAAEAWNEKGWQAFQHLLHQETPSWWIGTNIPGKRREPLLWMGGVQSWRNECTEALKDWSSFTVSKQAA